MKDVSLRPAAPVAGRRALNRARAGRHAYPYILVAPVVFLVALGVLYPVAYMLFLSGHDYGLLRPGSFRFIGLGNYVKLLQDAEFWSSLRVSAIWVAGSVIPQFLVGLGMALLLNERFCGRSAVRTIVLLPWVVSGVVTGIIWVWLFDGTFGIINDMLMNVGVIAKPVAWSIRPGTAFLMLFVANAWRGAPFFAINFLAALQSISPELYEAAKIDGADGFKRFRYVTFPLIFGTVVLSTLLRAIWTFNFVDLIWTITGGGPISSTRTLAIYVFDVAYRDAEFGYASTLAVALCVVLLVFSAVYWSLNRLNPEA